MSKGTIDNGVAALASVVFLDSGAGSFSAASVGTWNYSGSQTLDHVRGSTYGGSGLEYTSGNISYSEHRTAGYTQTDAVRNDAWATGSFTSYQAGCFTNDDYALSSLVMDSTASFSWKDHVLASQSYSGSGHIYTEGDGKHNLSESDSNGNVGSAANYSSTSTETFSYLGSVSATYNGDGVGSFSAHSAGCVANGSTSLSSYVYRESSVANSSFAYLELQSAGSSFSSWEGNTTDAHTTGAGSGGYAGADATTHNKTTEASFSSTHCLTLNALGSAVGSVYEAGVYNNGSFSLSSVVLNASSTGSLTMATLFRQDQSGSSQATWTATGTSQGGESGAGTEEGGGSGGLSGSYTTTRGQSDSFSAMFTNSKS